VLIRTSASGVCHSDLHFVEGSYGHPLPVVLGHEAAGTVEAVGNAGKEELDSKLGLLTGSALEIIGEFESQLSSDESMLYEDFDLTTTVTKDKSLFDKVMTEVSSEVGSSLGFVQDSDFSK